MNRAVSLSINAVIVMLGGAVVGKLPKPIAAVRSTVLKSAVMGVQVRMLGPPQVRTNETWCEFPPGKTSALLLFLAYQATSVSRDELLYLFWPDATETQARTNLRQMLARVKTLPFTASLDANSTCLRWLVATDLQVFKAALAVKNWKESLDLYRGELLQGFRSDAIPEFESWLGLERTTLHATWRETALKVVSDLEHTGRHMPAVAVLDKLRCADPFDQEVQRGYLRSLYLSGQRGRALASFETLRELLAHELGGQPEPLTLMLVERIRRQEPLEEGAEESTKTPVPHLSSLPSWTTPFVGRQDEKDALAALLADSDCRLLTLVGPGGVGKTRLALAVAESQRRAFGDGVHFVPLETVSAANLIVPAVAKALAFRFYGADEPKAQLLNHLHDKEMLLVLDNLEHLLAGATLLAEMLTAAPRLKLLVTSRARLDLQGEWLFDLGGLSFPEHDNPENVQAYDAVQLFVQSARRADNSFRWRDHIPVIARLCRSVEGLPLALELAAAWLRVLSPTALVAEVEHSFELLASSEPDRLERHQSLRAVFDHSWELLSERERAALAKLTVFRGGFSKEAAAEVADATLPVLLSLTNKSLLRQKSGRFGQHPLIHQYAVEKLAEHEREQQAVGQKHATYFLALVGRAEQELRGPEQASWLDHLEVEHDNLRAALVFTLRGGTEPEAGLRLAGALTNFWHLRGHVSEGRAWLTEALTKPEAAARTLERIKLLLGAGALAVLQGDHGAARPLLEESLALSRVLGDERRTASVLNALGRLALGQDDAAAARSFIEEELSIWRERGDDKSAAASLANLGSVRLMQGDYASARSHYEASLELGRTLGNDFDVARVLHNLGVVAYKQGDYNSARQRYQESLRVKSRLKYHEGVAYTLGALASLAATEGKPLRAVHLWGAAEALREAAGVSVPVSALAEFERDVEATRGQLQGGFAAAWAEGRTMPLAQAVAYALDGEEDGR